MSRFDAWDIWGSVCVLRVLYVSAFSIHQSYFYLFRLHMSACALLAILFCRRKRAIFTWNRFWYGMRGAHDMYYNENIWSIISKLRSHSHSMVTYSYTIYRSSGGASQQYCVWKMKIDSAKYYTLHHTAPYCTKVHKSNIWLGVTRELRWSLQLYQMNSTLTKLHKLLPTNGKFVCEWRTIKERIRDMTFSSTIHSNCVCVARERENKKWWIMACTRHTLRFYIPYVCLCRGRCGAAYRRTDTEYCQFIRYLCEH